MLKFSIVSEEKLCSRDAARVTFDRLYVLHHSFRRVTEESGRRSPAGVAPAIFAAAVPFNLQECHRGRDRGERNANVKLSS